MKVQIFPKTVRRGEPFFVHLLGALTLKPSAYQARPWELTRVTVFNHYEGQGALVFTLRGTRVVQVSQTAGWMKDRIRFLYDGFRRQRLTLPHWRGSPVSWSLGLTFFFTLTGGKNFTFKVDPEGVHFYWLLRGYNLFRDARGPARGVSLDSNFEGTVYHGAFGLKAAHKAALALPGCLTHEEEQVLSSPTGGTSLFLAGALLPQVLSSSAPGAGYRWGRFLTPGESYPRVPQRALFQVSPLQGLLREW